MSLVVINSNTAIICYHDRQISFCKFCRLWFEGVCLHKIYNSGWNFQSLILLSNFLFSWCWVCFHFWFFCLFFCSKRLMIRCLKVNVIISMTCVYEIKDLSLLILCVVRICTVSVTEFSTLEHTAYKFLDFVVVAYKGRLFNGWAGKNIWFDLTFKATKPNKMWNKILCKNTISLIVWLLFFLFLCCFCK